jgi:S1-C subfamily serine protease
VRSSPSTTRNPSASFRTRTRFADVFSSAFRSAFARALACFLACAIVCVFAGLALVAAQTPNKSDLDSATAALCPVVYPDDQSPASRGYHYTFFGNSFFINDQGYLLTVAHVLETFRNGGQPYVLVNRVNAPPQLMQASIVAQDAAHDVAILRVTPNPFAGKYKVAFLSLSSEPAVQGESVLALSLHPKRLQSAYSFEFEREDSSPGTVLSYESTHLANSAPPADVFLLSHPVVKGQSGSPVLDLSSHGVVGLVEGLWLRDNALSLEQAGAQGGSTPGAAIPIRYAIPLLQQHAIAWHTTAVQASATPATN